MKMLVFVDTETTGLDDGRLVELAWKKDGDLVVTGPMRFKPPVPIEIEAMATHHITEEDVAGKTVFAGSRTAADLQQILGERILVAHNAPFDIGVLEREGIKARWFIDTKKVARTLYQDFPQHSLQYLRYALGVRVKADAHSAAGDVAVLEAVFGEMCVEALATVAGVADEESLVSWMMKVSAQPVIMKVVNFGKHKGRTFEAVAAADPAYLQWILKSDMDEDAKASASFWLSEAMKAGGV